MSYVIITDSCANLTDEMIEKNNISIIPLSFHVNGEEYKSYEKGKKSDLKKFYNMMRQKESITTSLVSPDQFTQFFLVNIAQLHGLLVAGVGIQIQAQVIQCELIGPDPSLDLSSVNHGGPSFRRTAGSAPGK